MSSTVLSSGPHQDNLVELDSIPRLPRPPPTRVPAGGLVHLAFRPEDLELRAALYLVGLSYEDGSNRGLTARELRLVHQVVSPLLGTGTGLEDLDCQIAKLAAAGYDLEHRRAVYGPGAERLRVWVARRLLAVWGFYTLTGLPPEWLFQLAEIFAQRIITSDFTNLPSFDQFEDWEITARIQHQIDHVCR